MPLVVADATAVTTVSDGLKAMVTYVFSIIGEVIDTVVLNPILMIPIALTLVFAGIRAAKKLMGSRKKG